MVISKKTIIFQGFNGGPTFSRRCPTFSGGGGGGGLISIETHIACDFIPPLDPHMQGIHQMLRRTQPVARQRPGSLGLNII